MGDNEFTAMGHNEVRISTVECPSFAEIVRGLPGIMTPLSEPFDRKPNGPDQEYWLELERSSRVRKYLEGQGYGVTKDAGNFDYFGSNGGIDGMIGMPFRFVMTQSQPYGDNEALFRKSTIAAVQECLFTDGEGNPASTIDDVAKMNVADYYVPCIVTAMWSNIHVHSIGLIDAKLNGIDAVDVIALDGGNVYLYHGHKDNNRDGMIIEMKHHLRDRERMMPILGEMTQAVPAHAYKPIVRNPHTRT